MLRVPFVAHAAFLFVSLCLLNAGSSFGQLFQHVPTNMEGMEYGSLDWGDYDNDGDLDLLATGCIAGCVVGDLSLYQNHDGAFVKVDLDDLRRNVHRGDARWADYDNDGDLDFVVTGSAAGQGRRTSLVRNDFGNFVLDTNSSFTGLGNSALDWGDYDNDGDLDLLIIGDNDDGDPIIEIYQNTKGILQLRLAASSGVEYGTADWIDYNGDGALDIFLTGINGQDEFALLYSHDGLSETPGFTFVETGIVNLHRSSTDWGDYDNDGDPDLILTGCQGFNFCSDALSYIYHNDNGTLVNLNSDLREVRDGSSNWIDYDSDGDLDVLVSGGLATVLYSNTNGVFTEVNEGIGSVLYSASAWGDYDMDGRPDLFMAGFFVGEQMLLFRNTTSNVNTPPVAPVLDAPEIEDGPIVTLSWSGASDRSTPSAGLTYNLRIGTVSGGVDVMSPEGFAANARYLTQTGNTGSNTFYNLIGLPAGTYYWSVQAVDHGFQGSAYSREEVFTIGSDQVVSNEDLLGLPKATGLRANYPNPFSSETTISVDIASPVSARLVLYNLQGQLVRQLHDGHLTVGTHSFTLSRSDLPAGVLFYQLQANGQIFTRKMTVVN